jgi:hypothetical protein
MACRIIEDMSYLAAAIILISLPRLCTTDFSSPTILKPRTPMKFSHQCIVRYEYMFSNHIAVQLHRTDI